MGAIFEDMWKWKSARLTTSRKAGYAPPRHRNISIVTLLDRSDEALTTEQPRLPYGVSKRWELFVYTFPCLFFSDNKVLIVIGGDNNYRDEDEQGRSVISRWAKRKVASQFGEEYLDGRQSFIFSWNEKHRPIHEEAMRHYLDPGKRGSKFEYTPPKLLQKAIEPEVPQPSPKPIPPVIPRPASADTDLSREVGDNLLLPLNFRIINPFTLQRRIWNRNSILIAVKDISFELWHHNIFFTDSPPNRTPSPTLVVKGFLKTPFLLTPGLFIAVVGDKWA